MSYYLGNLLVEQGSPEGARSLYPLKWQPGPRDSTLHGVIFRGSCPALEASLEPTTRCRHLPASCLSGLQGQTAETPNCTAVMPVLVLSMEVCGGEFRLRLASLHPPVSGVGAGRSSKGMRPTPANKEPHHHD